MIIVGFLRLQDTNINIQVIAEPICTVHGKCDHPTKSWEAYAPLLCESDGLPSS